MFSPHAQEGKKSPGGPRPSVPSQAFEWIWRYLRDVEKPHILDCGTVSSASVKVFTERQAKVFVADLIAPLQRGDPAYWRLLDKQEVFCLDEFLARFPKIPPASLQLVCCWHLFDLIPRDQLAGLFHFLLSLLEDDGVLHCFLREPSLKTGRDGRWWFESPASLGAEGDTKGDFLYPPVSNRDVGKLAEGLSLKTFLTRSHRREVVVTKRGDY